MDRKKTCLFNQFLLFWLKMKETNYTRLETLFARNGGFITRKQVDAENIQSWFLTDFIRRKNLLKIDKGFYADEEWVRDDFFVFQYKYPRFVFSFTSALFLHGLADALPAMLEISGPKNYRPFSPDGSVIIHSISNEEIYQLGQAKLKTNLGNEVLAYDVERTICDLVKNTNRVDSEIYTKAIHAFVKRKDRDVEKLMRYSRTMGIESKVSNLMMVLINED